MRKHVLLYGILGGILIAGLKFIEYRWLVVEHSAEIYGGLVAAIFAGLGIWLGLKLTRHTVEVREVMVEAPAHFVRDQTQVDTLGITPRELEILELIAAGLTNKEIAERVFVSENTDKGEIIGYATMVAAFLMVFFGVKSYRDNAPGGSVTFGRAFMVGLMITLIASFCYVAAWEVISYKFVPDFADKYAALTLEKARKSGATDAQIAEQTRQMEQFKEMYKNPLLKIAMTLVEPLPVGLTFTLVTAGVLSRKRWSQLV